MKRIPVDLLGQAITRQLDPANLAPGEYSLNGTATLTLACAVSKGEPVDSLETLTLPWAAVIASIMRRAKVRPEVASAWVSRAIKDVVLMPDQDAHLLAIAGYLKQLRAAQPTKLKEGATKVSGTVEIVGWNG